MPVINENWTSYQVNGTTTQQLRDEMIRLGPEDNGKHYFANTVWQVKWHYNYQESDKQCQITSVQTNTTITYDLPAWPGYASANTELQQEWAVFQQHLRQHEQGHALLGKQAAIDIEIMLQHLSLASDCQTLETVANDKAAQIIRWYHDKDIAYDNETNHGISQGATLR